MNKDIYNLFEEYNQKLLVKVNSDTREIVAAILTLTDILQPEAELIVENPEDKFVKDGHAYNVWVDHRGPFWDEFFFYTEETTPRTLSPLYRCDPAVLETSIKSAWASYTAGIPDSQEIEKWNSDL